MHIPHLLLLTYIVCVPLVCTVQQPSLDQVLTFNAPGPWSYVFAEEDLKEAFEVVNTFRNSQFNANSLKWESSLIPAVDDSSPLKEVNIGFAKSVNGNRKAFLYDVFGSIWNETVRSCLLCDSAKCETKANCNLPIQILNGDAQSIGCSLVLKRKEVQPLGIPRLQAKLACKTSPPTGSFYLKLRNGIHTTPNRLSAPENDPNNYKKHHHHHHHHHHDHPGILYDTPLNSPSFQVNTANSSANIQGISIVKKREVIQVPLSREHYDKFLQIDPSQGWELVQSINISRAAVSKRRLSIPSSKFMSTLTWSDDLAKQAYHKLKSKSRHHYIEVIDLQFIEMLPDYANRPDELKFKNMAIELDLQNLLMWLVKQYFKKFANGGLRCSRNNCRANCRKHHGTECYAFELIHDQAENIGCAVKFHKEGGPILQADLTCILGNSVDHGGLIIYKVGEACSACTTSCDKNLRLCVLKKQLENDKNKYLWQQTPSEMLTVGKA